MTTEIWSRYEVKLSEFLWACSRNVLDLARSICDFRDSFVKLFRYQSFLCWQCPPPHDLKLRGDQNEILYATARLARTPFSIRQT